MTADRFRADGPADHVSFQLVSDGTVSGAPRVWLAPALIVALVNGVVNAWLFLTR